MGAEKLELDGPDARARRHLRRGWARRWLLATLWLTAIASTADGVPPHLMWMSRRDTVARQAFWIQAWPTGQAWLLARSESYANDLPRVRITLEIAFEIEPQNYQRARAALTAIGLRSGQQAENEEMGFGVDAPPTHATHLLKEPEGTPWLDRTTTRRLADEIEALVGLGGLEYAAVARDLQLVLRSAAVACFVGPREQVALVATRDASGDFQARAMEGDSCLRAAAVRHIAGLRWPPAVAQVSVRAEIAGVAASVHVTYDDRVPLQVDGRDLEEVVSPRSAGPARGKHARAVEGIWREHMATFRPRSRADAEAAVPVVNRTAVYFPRGLWDDALTIAVEHRDGARTLVGGRLEWRRNTLTRCQRIRDCAALTAAEIRGLAAAAYGQCLELKAEARRAPEVERVDSIHVAIGSDTCSVNLTRRCLPTRYQEALGARAGLRSLFTRLSDLADEALAASATSGFAPCRELEPMEELGVQMKSSKQP